MVTPPSVPPSPTFGDPSAFGATPPTPPQAEAAPVGGWSVGAARGASWWTGGWRLFTRAPVIWIVIVILFAALMVGLSLIPIFGQLASALLSPVLAAGILLGCRELDQGRALRVGHLVAGFNDRLTSLVVVGLLYLGGWVVIVSVGVIAMLGVIGLGGLSALAHGDGPAAAFELLGAIGGGAIVLMLVVLAFSIPLVMAYWFAPALVIFRGDEPLAAMRNSFVASLRNVPPFLIYSLLGLVFAIVATILFGLGWFVLAPVFAASIFVSYEDIFGIPAWSRTP